MPERSFAKPVFLLFCAIVVLVIVGLCCINGIFNHPNKQVKHRSTPTITRNQSRQVINISAGDCLIESIDCPDEKVVKSSDFSDITIETDKTRTKTTISQQFIEYAEIYVRLKTRAKVPCSISIETKGGHPFSGIYFFSPTSLKSESGLIIVIDKGRISTQSTIGHQMPEPQSLGFGRTVPINVSSPLGHPAMVLFITKYLFISIFFNKPGFDELSYQKINCRQADNSHK